MLSSSNAPSRKERNVASDDDEDPFTFAIETPLLFLPLLLSSTASKISASTDTSSSFLRRAFSANEVKDEDDFEDDDDDDFRRTMENFFCCDFDFSKRFEEEEEKEDEEHAIIETEVAVEAMMTKTTTRSVRSVLSVMMFYYTARSLNIFSNSRGAPRKKRVAQKWLKKGGKKNIFDSYDMFFWSQNGGVPHQSQSRRFSCFSSLAGLVVWFT